MSSSPLVIWGAAGHARVVADIVRQQGQFRIVGFIDSTDSGRQGGAFAGSTVLGGRECLPGLLEQGVRHCLIAIGDCAARVRLAAEAQALGFSLPVAVHSQAVLADDTEVGEGTVVMAGAVVNPGSRVGANVILNTGATVDHDCVLADGVHISPGAHLAGWVRVGAETWLGIGTAVSDHVEIGPHSIVGAGSLVLDDIPANVVAWGSPARTRRPNQPGDGQP